MRRARTLLFGFAVGLAACSGGATGGTGASSSTGSGSGTGGATATVIISNFAYSPDPLTVAAGTTITFVNKDSMAHTATSEAAAKDYVPGTASNGFSFNAQVPQNGSATVTVPATVTSGTTQPYYCAVHKGGMANPDPVIKIQ